MLQMRHHICHIVVGSLPSHCSVKFYDLRLISWYLSDALLLPLSTQIDRTYLDEVVVACCTQATESVIVASYG